MKTNNSGATNIARWGVRLGCLTLCGAMGALLTAPAVARAESARFDITAQPLPAALKKFAAQARMQLLYEQDTIVNASGNAVSGELDKHTALELLLRDTGLEVVYSSDGAATIRRADSDKAAAAGAGDVSKSERLRTTRAGRSAARHDALAESSMVEEIIVSARRREENIQTVPVSITVVSQAALQENNVQTMGDLQYLVPSMSALSGITRDALNLGIRGQGTSGISSLPGVIAYLNEVPIPTDKDGNVSGGPGLLFDLENVQVLKGPQGTLFGRNTTGGALLLQTKRPTNEPGGRIQLGYGNYDAREVDGAINIPIVEDKLLTRVAFAGQQRDGFTRLHGEPGHPNGIDADNRDYWGVRATVSFRPTDGFQNDIIATYSEYDSHGAPIILSHLNPNGLGPRAFPAYATMFAQQQALGIRDAIPVDTHLESSGSNLTINNISRLALSDELTFRNIFGYNEANTVYQLDLDGSAAPVAAIPSTPRDQTVRQFTDEAQLLGKSFDGRLDWIVGAFFLKQNPPSEYVLQTSTLFGSPADAEYRQAEKSQGLFAQGTYDLSALVNGLKLTAGARYTWDERFYKQRGGALGTRCTQPQVNCSTTTTREPESSALTWTAGVDYQVAPETLLYLTSRRGYRAGGSNLATINGQVLDFDPEFVTDFELGVKSDWRLASIPVRTNVAVYYQDYDDIQVTQRVVIGGIPGSTTSNAASARVWGAEVEALVQVTADLQLGASFDYLDFEYREFGPGVNAAQLEATRTVNRPPRKYGASARYHLPIAPQIGDVSMQVNWNWQASHGDTSQVGGIIDSFGLLNIAANWNEIVGKPLDASLFVSNATDEVYTSGILALYTTSGFTARRYGEPRMYGVRLRYRFGADAQ